MKGPLDTQDEVPAANSASNTGEGFSEYMWMAEEGVEDFDKKVLSKYQYLILLYKICFVQGCWLLCGQSVHTASNSVENM